MIFNLSGGGGSGGTLTVTAPAGVTVKVTNSDETKVKTKTADNDGCAVFKGLDTGWWMLEISDGDRTARKPVNIISDYTTEIAFFAATISVTYPEGSTCTATDGVTALTAPDTSGTWECIVPNSGTWTVTATDGSSTKSNQVEITTDGQIESVTLSYKVFIIQDGAVDVDKYTYTYWKQYWNSLQNTVSTESGGVGTSEIKQEQTYDGKPALWLATTNGYHEKHNFANITVPGGATKFVIEYYLLAAYNHDPVFTLGGTSISVDRGSNSKVENGTAIIDVTGIQGETVTLTYDSYGKSSNTDNYIGNAWFE